MVVPSRTDGFNILKDLCPACSAKLPSLSALAHTILLQGVIYIVKAERPSVIGGAEDDVDLAALINENIRAEFIVTGDLMGWLEDSWGQQYILNAAIDISRLWIE
ncbi:hypothetical protein BPOR_0060g00080 [Botrytis porri]|uniref:Uncharacterized protein n=1 Tax=Botrytis porri TaxID=87229 RepID=A0A4Z1L143_9HELO|nr:hypothetical protein BPOR_0060g00080 [Botrytis porri]